MKCVIPENEKKRLENLESYMILDTYSEQEYDDIAQLVSYICRTPISTLAFIDGKRKWHKSKVGIAKEFVPREISICSHTIMDTQTLIINDTKESEAFKNIGMVVNAPHIRFYAGVPLISPEGFAIGTLCALDIKPNVLDDKQIEALEALARSVISLLVARRNVSYLEKNHLALESSHREINDLNLKLEALSRTDELTGLWNRRVLNETIDRELSVNNRTHRTMGVILLDLDKFKAINDEYGHQAGDEAIKLVASILKNEVREIDYCIRYGGDEFVIIVLGINQEFLISLSERISHEIEHASQIIKRFSVSIGIALVESSDVDRERILNVADSCLYQAKEQEGSQAVLKVI